MLEVEVHDRGKALQLEMAAHDKMREMGSVQDRQAVVAAEPAVVVLFLLIVLPFFFVGLTGYSARRYCLAPRGSIPDRTVALSRSAMPFLVNPLKWLI